MTVFAKNKKAFADYHFLEKIEAGLALTGAETRAIREGNVSLRGSFVSLHHGKLFLINAHIGKYTKASGETAHEALRERPLLVRGEELRRLIGRIQEKGLTLVPLSLYSKGPWIKLEFAVARGAVKYEKRERIKKRDSDRDIQRAMRDR